MSPARPCPGDGRSEEHTSELQSLRHLVCRLLLEKKKDRKDTWRGARLNTRRVARRATRAVHPRVDPAERKKPDLKQRGVNIIFYCRSFFKAGRPQQIPSFPPPSLFPT